MKERGIIFSDAMVRAIIDGTKTQTRRIVKRQPIDREWIQKDGDGWMYAMLKDSENATIPLRCPYGTVGDRLWVRETHALDPPVDGTWDYYGYTDGLLENIDAIPERFRNPDHVIYRASWKGSDLRWRPSIFTPRWASRITLEVTNVRVERLLDITNDDALAEGILPVEGNCGFSWQDGKPTERPCCECCDRPVERFSDLWQKINGKTYPWHSNPWVWVIEFTKL